MSEYKGKAIAQENACKAQGFVAWSAWTPPPTGHLAVKERLERYIPTGAIPPSERDRPSLDVGLNDLLQRVEKAADTAALEAIGAAISAVLLQIDVDAAERRARHQGHAVHPLDALAMRGALSGDKALRHGVACWVEARITHYTEGQPAAAPFIPSGWADNERVMAIRIRSRLKNEATLRSAIRGVMFDHVAAQAVICAQNPHLISWRNYTSRCKAAVQLAEQVGLDAPMGFAAAARDGRDPPSTAQLHAHRQAKARFMDEMAYGGADIVEKDLAEFERNVKEWADAWAPQAKQ